MTKRNFKLIFFVVCFISAFSCNDELTLNLPLPDDKIVIDGWIDGGQYAKVLLTRNSPYFSSIDSASLRDLVLTAAKVTLTDGDKTEILILRLPGGLNRRLQLTAPWSR